MSLFGQIHNGGIDNQILAAGAAPSGKGANSTSQITSAKNKHKKSVKKVANLSSASTAAVGGAPNQHHSPLLNGHYGAPNSGQVQKEH